MPKKLVAKPKSLALIALLLLVPAPTIGVIMAMYIAPGSLGQTVFMLTKIWLVAFPVIWIWKFDQEKLTIPKLSTNGLGMATLSGILIFIGIGLSYLMIKSQGLLDTSSLAKTATQVGLSTPTIYILGAIYWCTINSLIEEYVWRWFVFTRCERLMPKLCAVIFAGLFFTLHHIWAIAVYFNLPLTILASVGVFIGGSTWSWLYLRYRNIYASYLSHVFADIIIFLIGYQLFFGS